MRKTSNRKKQPLSMLFCLLLLTFSGCSGILGSGGAWQPSGLQQHAIQALLVDPANSQQLYAGDDEGTLFASSDGGQHWNKQGSGLQPPAFINVLAFSANGKQLYAGTQQGLFISDDSARHWHLAAASARRAQGGSILALTVITGSSPNGTLCIATDNGVFLSTDSGETWTYSARGLERSALVRGLSYDPNTRQLWAATSAGVYRSDDQAASWRAYSSGLPAAVNVYTVVPAIIAGGPQSRIYAGTEHGFFISTDDGAHWAASHDSLSRVRILAILVDFRSANVSTLYAGTSVGALRSDDGGEHWGGVASGIATTTTVHALQIGGAGNSQLYAATDDGLYLYPGSGGGFDVSRILAIALAVLIFAALYLLVSRMRRRAGRGVPHETK